MDNYLQLLIVPNTNESYLVFKNKYSYNKMIYESVTNWKYSHILGIYNNLIIMNFINDKTDNIE